MSDLSNISKMLIQSDELLEKYGDYPVPKEYYNLRALLMAQAIRSGCHAAIEKEERVATLEKKKVSDLIFEKENDREPLKKFIHVDIQGTNFKIQDKYLFKVMPEDYDSLVLKRASIIENDTEDIEDTSDEHSTDTSEDAVNTDFNTDDEEDYDSFFKPDAPASDEPDMTEQESDDFENTELMFDDVETQEEQKSTSAFSMTDTEGDEMPDITDDKDEPEYENDLSALDDLPDPYEKAQKEPEEAPEVDIDDDYLTSLYDDDTDEGAEESENIEPAIEPEPEPEPEIESDGSMEDITNRLPVFKKYPNCPPDPENGKVADSFLYNQHKITITNDSGTQEYDFFVYPLKIEKENLSTDIFVVAVMDHKHIRAGVSRGKTSAVNIAFNDNFLIRGSWKKGIFNSQVMCMSDTKADIKDEIVASDTRKIKTQYTYMNIPTDTDDEIYLFPGSIKENDDNTGLARAAMVLKTKKDVIVLSPTQEGTFALNNGAIQVECFWIGDRLEYNIL